VLEETGIGELSGHQGEEEGKEPLNTADESGFGGEIPVFILNTWAHRTAIGFWSVKTT